MFKHTSDLYPVNYNETMYLLVTMLQTVTNTILRGPKNIIAGKLFIDITNITI